MKHLISATLSPAAAAVWESWPTKNKANNEIGRSARLSELIESSADLRNKLSLEESGTSKA